jgi:proteic killer suppression protein
MLLTFEKEYLRELYETGKTRNKKYRFQPEVIDAYVKGLYFLEKASSVEELYQYHSLHYEALRGDKKGLFSIRATHKYRIEFEVTEVLKEDTFIEVKVTVCNIIELSNHYK